MIVGLPAAGHGRTIAMIIGRHVHLAPDDRPNARFQGSPVKLECAENIAVVGHRNSRHIHRRNLLSKNRNLDRRIQQRIVGVEVEMNKRRYFGMPAHAAMIPRPTNLAPPPPPLSRGLFGPNPFTRYDSSRSAAIPGQMSSRFQECSNELSYRSIFRLLLQLKFQFIDEISIKERNSEVIS